MDANVGALSGWLREHDLAPTLRTAVDRLAGGDAARLVPGDDPDEARDVLAQLVGDVVAQQLVAAGHARFVVGWESPLELRADDDTTIDPWHAAREVNDTSADFVAQATAWGASPDVLLPEPAATAERRVAEVPAAQDEVVGAVLLAGRSKLGQQLVATHREIILRRVDGRDRLTALSRMGRTDALLARVHGRSVADVEADDRATVVRYADIALVQLDMRRRRMTLTIQPHTGHALEVAIRKSSPVVGEPFAALQHYLGDRYRVREA